MPERIVPIGSGGYPIPPGEIVISIRWDPATHQARLESPLVPVVTLRILLVVVDQALAASAAVQGAPEATTQ